jgi:BirA family biotin operon repressor/biotin-[acetyl-CoA-carboxylase] ligase
MITLLDETDSTNDLALKAADQGAEHGSCWVADRQTKGRGRREVGGDRRVWFSPGRANIYMSLLLRPDLQPAEASTITLAAAVGCADAIVGETDADVWVKWPNDLYVGDLKLGGILTEANSGDGELDSVIVGLGLNVNVTADQVPDELSDIMTSLQIETGERWDRMSLAFALRENLLERAEQFAESGLAGIIEDLRSYDRTPGRTVEVQQNGDWVEGVSRGIADDGTLVVEVRGENVEVQAGEVRF